MTNTDATASGDTTFEDRLLVALLDRAVEMEVAGPATTPPAPRATHHRRLALTGAAALALAVGAAGVVSVTNRSDGGPPATTAQPNTVDLPALSLATVRAKATAAINSADDYVLHVVASRPTDSEIPTVDLWWDRTDGRHYRFVTHDASGAPVYDMSGEVADDGTARLRFVDHAKRTWYDSDRGGIKRPSEGPDEIRARLASGGLQLVGEENLDGVVTLHLRDAEAPAMERHLWVDADSFLPVRTTYADDHGGFGEQSKFTWLPRTEANLAQVAAVVPEGFRQVDAPSPNASTNSDGSRG